MAIWLANSIGENGYLGIDAAAFLVDEFEGALKTLGLADRNDLAMPIAGVAVLAIAGAVVLLVAWWRKS